MYTHLHGSSSSAQEKEKLRENLRLFVRLGSSETGDYYEYEQPLKPTDVPGAKGSQTLWPEKYEMNLLLERLNQLKIARGQTGMPTDTTFTSRQVNLNLDFAPPETVLKIHGTPSLQKVQTIVVGVRHAGNPDASPRPPVLRNFELWVNELRVSGFDEQKGWAANANATINLADFVSVNGSFQRRTDGFGALSSTLNERERSDNTSWNVRADVNLDAFLPERQGWKIPVSLQVQSSRTIPRFDPNRGDVRVSSIVKQFNALPDSTIQDRFGNRYATQSTQKIRRLVQDSVRTAAETFNMRRTMTANVSKQDSDSWWMRKTIDKTSLNFSYLDRSSHNAQYQLKDKWGWSGSFQYQLSFGQARTVRPLGFLPNLPVLGALSNLTFNYVPRSISFTSSAERNATTTRSRSRNQQTSQTLPTRVAFPLREQQQFNHRRNFSFQYDPFGFLSLNFDTNTRQSFNDIASRVQTNVIVRGEPAVGDTVLTGIDINPDSTDLFFENPGSYFDNLPSDADITSGDKGKTIFFEERLFRRSELDVFRDLLRGRVSPRTSDYEQRFSATLSMGWVDQKALNWIDLKDVSYQSSFKWTNGSKGSLTGASVDNSLTVRTGVSLHPNKVWERFGFFQKLKKAQSQSGQGEQGEREKQGRTSEEGAGEEGEPTEGERKEGDSEKGEGKESTEEGGLSLEDIPLPNPVGMLRGVALMVLDIKDLSVNYNGDWSSRSSNVGSLAADRSDVKVNYSLLDALRGDGPPVGYRFGLSRSIDPRTERVLLERFQVSDALSNRHQFEGRTTLSPSQALQMDLSWNVEWRQQSNVSFRRIDREDGEGGGGGNAVGRFKTESGENSSSVWGFGSFTSLFEEQVNQLQQNVEGEGEGIRAAGDVALTTSSVATDFREAFLTGKGTLGSHGFVPFPTPGWNVRYSGFSDWPLLGRIVKSASLSHSYNAEYKSSFSSVSTAGDTTNLSVGGQKVRYVRPDFEIGSTQVSEQFQPLLGLNLTWPGDLQTSVEWNQQVTTYLRTAGLKVEEVETSELSGSISYRKRGLRIPLLGLGRLENQIQFSLTLSRSINDERSFNLRGALTKARENDFTVDPAQAEKPTNNYVTVRKQTTRLKITPELTYRLSDQVTANFLLEYEQFEGNSSRQPSYTRINGGFNVRVDITQN